MYGSGFETTPGPGAGGSFLLPLSTLFPHVGFFVGLLQQQFMVKLQSRHHSIFFFLQLKSYKQKNTCKKNNCSTFH